MNASGFDAVCRAACTLGLPVFPCRANKAPACPRGFHDASSNPDVIASLWQRHPGPLIGVATGAASGIAVLDIDAKGGTLPAWWHANRPRLAQTRTHRTRSGGLHLLFRHTPGLRCSAGKIAPGVDVRADGGYIIWWPAEGLPVLADCPPAPWPERLRIAPEPPQPPMRSDASHVADTYGQAALRCAVARVAGAPNGERNTTLYDETHSLLRPQLRGVLAASEVARAMASAALAAGLPAHEIEMTLRSALAARGAA